MQRQLPAQRLAHRMDAAPRGALAPDLPAQMVFLGAPHPAPAGLGRIPFLNLDFGQNESVRFDQFRVEGLGFMRSELVSQR